MIRRLLLLLVVLSFNSVAQAQITATPLKPGYDNAISAGISRGSVSSRDAKFYGVSIDYGYRVADRWSITGALMWDKETEKSDSKPEQSIKTVTLAGTVSYLINDWISMSTGLGKGFADNNNPSGKMEFTNADWSTGLILGFATPGLPFWDRDVIGVSLAYEYNLSQNEPMISADFTIGWSF